MFRSGFPGFFGQQFGGEEEFEEEDYHEEQGDEQSRDNTELYKIMGLEPQADISLVKKAYLKACVKGEYRHPDKGGCPEKFKLLQQANEILSDAEKKKLYDKGGLAAVKRSEQGGGRGENPFDFFFNRSQGQGRGAERKQKMQGVRKEVEVTLEDAYNGNMTTFIHTRKRNCETCDGKGGANVKKCGECKGRGTVTKMVNLGPGFYSQTQQECTKCRGQGEIMDPKDKCKTCNGKKIKDDKKKIEVALESGVYDGWETVYTGEHDEMPGVMPGDLHVRIRIKKHDIFQRKGADLFMEKQITLLESLTGFNFQIKHLDGKVHTISTRPQEVVSSHSTKTVRNMGMPFFKDPYQHGNLHIKFIVQFPKQNSFTPEQIKALQGILPYTPQKPLPKNEKEFEYFDEYNEHERNTNPEGGRKMEEEEDDDEEGYSRGGGQGAQCAQQ